MSVGDAIDIAVGNPVSDTIGNILEALDGRLLPVRINVELDEQEQIAGQNTTSKQGSRLSASAVSGNWGVPVLDGEARVRCKSRISDLRGRSAD